jgi:hypothetical protein
MVNHPALSGNSALLVQNGLLPVKNSQDTQDTQDSAAQRDLVAFLDIADQAEDAKELQTLTDKFFGDETSNKDSEKGVLAAGAILQQTCMSPTGTQVINTLSVDANVIAQFVGLKTFHISPLFRRLASFVPSLQETYGRKLTTFTDG